MANPTETVSSIYLHRPLDSDLGVPEHLKRGFNEFCNKTLGKHTLRAVHFARVNDFGITIISPEEMVRFHEIIGEPFGDEEVEKLGTFLATTLPARADEAIKVKTFPLSVEEIGEEETKVLLATGASSLDRMMCQGFIQNYYGLDAEASNLLWPNDGVNTGFQLAESRHALAPQVRRLLGDFILSMESEFPTKLTFDALHIDLVDYDANVEGAAMLSVSDRGGTGGCE